ncbi:hypothetical protein MSAN_00539500 [Mycena sanguinolenta]|uniref:Uncharacterized protein n=1 Tax=Mycena sanguinolenta TaxID=230812 RepID=A0A8H7DHF4_9AGAR|nr:hypothetical protein MSAN_00539500 [Mycena sanguinolenta]
MGRALSFSNPSTLDESQTRRQQSPQYGPVRMIYNLGNGIFTTRRLGCVNAESSSFSVIEKLLIASDCNLNPTSGIIAQRYLTGILELPAFWQGSGPLYTATFSKILHRLICVLKDLGLESGDRKEYIDLIFDNEGIDSLASAVLVGVASWHLASPQSQRWYHVLLQILRLLRLPEAQPLLPKSSAFAVDAEMKRIVPDTAPETLEGLAFIEDATETLLMHTDRISVGSIGDELDGSFIQASGVGPQRIGFTEATVSFQWPSIRSEVSRLLRWPTSLRQRTRVPELPNIHTARTWIPEQRRFSPYRSHAKHAAVSSSDPHATNDDERQSPMSSVSSPSFSMGSPVTNDAASSSDLHAMSDDEQQSAVSSASSMSLATSLVANNAASSLDPHATNDDEQQSTVASSPVVNGATWSADLHAQQLM